MQRVTFRAPKEQINRVEELVEEGKFMNRSEALRAAIRDLVDDDGDAVGEHSAGGRWSR